MKTITSFLVVALLLMLVNGRASAADGVETKPLHFARGTSPATVHGVLKGDRIIDYTLGARAGRTMSVTLETTNGANDFNVLPPGSKDVAIFIGSTSGNEWTGVLKQNGDYTVRVYLMRSVARRHETARYTLAIAITGDAPGPPLGTAPADDARVPGTSYHAIGAVPCAMGDAAPGSSQCEFGVIRGKPGNAEVHVTPPGGFERVLDFIGSDVSARGDARVKVRKQGDTWLIDVNDDEHYRIPGAVIVGG